MNFAVDTSAYSANARNDERVTKWFDPDNYIYIPIIMLAELRSGFANGTRQQLNDAILTEFLDSAYTEILHITEMTTHIYAEIFTTLRKIGKPINTNDMWIAALALENDLPLLTTDADFQNIKSLTLL